MEVIKLEEVEQVIIEGEDEAITLDDPQQIILLQEQVAHHALQAMEEQEPSPILKFDSYAEFKRAVTDYEAQTITKFILRNQSKNFKAPGEELVNLDYQEFIFWSMLLC